MERIRISIFLILLVVFQCQTSVVVSEVDYSQVPQTDENSVGSCNVYKKTVQTDDISGIQTTTYQCIQCQQSTLINKEQLFLARTPTGGLSCIKQMFYSAGCLEYSEANYPPDTPYLGVDIIKDAQGYLRARTCSKCPLDANRIISQNAFNYNQYIFSQEEVQQQIDFGGLDMLYQDKILVNITDIQYCIPLTQLISGCILYQGFTQLGSNGGPDGEYVWPNHDLLQPDTVTCIQCKSGFTIQSGCLECDTSAGLMNSNIQVYTCVPSTLNCFDYQGTDTCYTCNTGYQLQNNQCLNCADGYRKSDVTGSCIPVVLRCTTYASDVCTACAVGYKVQNGQCLNCADGYRKSDVTGSCIPVVLRCTTYASDVCTACAVGYKVQNGQCLNCADGYRKSDVTGSCIPVVLRCTTYASDVCTACAVGYKVQNGQCLNCADGYRKSDVTGSCILVVAGCSSYLLDVCQGCQPGKTYSIIYKNCSFTALVPHCSSYYNGACQQCQSGYDFPSDTNRLICLISTSIRHCNKMIKVKGKTTNLCNKCDDGYHLKSDFTLCISDIPNCQVNFDRTCLTCQYGFYLSTSKKQCLVNPTCLKDTIQWNYEAINGICVKIDANCSQYTQTGDCITCKRSYTLVSGKCNKKNTRSQGQSSSQASSS